MVVNLSGRLIDDHIHGGKLLIAQKQSDGSLNLAGIHADFRLAGQRTEALQLVCLQLHACGKQRQKLLADLQRALAFSVYLLGRRRVRALQSGQNRIINSAQTAGYIPPVQDIRQMLLIALKIGAHRFGFRAARLSA